MEEAHISFKSLYKLDHFGPSVCRGSSGEPFAKAYKVKSPQAKLMRKSHFKRKGVMEITYFWPISFTLDFMVKPMEKSHFKHELVYFSSL